MKYALLLIASLFFAAPAFAEEYEKGPNGGLMLDVAGKHTGLKISRKSATIQAAALEKTTASGPQRSTTAAAIVVRAGRTGGTRCMFT